MNALDRRQCSEMGTSAIPSIFNPGTLFQGVLLVRNSNFTPSQSSLPFPILLHLSFLLTSGNPSDQGLIRPVFIRIREVDFDEIPRVL